MSSQLTMQEEELRRGQWLEEEDERLAMIVAISGERRWDALAKDSGMISIYTMLTSYWHESEVISESRVSGRRITLFKYATMQG